MSVLEIPEALFLDSESDAQIELPPGLVNETEGAAPTFQAAWARAAQSNIGLT